jgi:Rap1a immunity proteins
MMRFGKWLSGVALCIGLSVGSANAAVTEDSFLLRSTGDLVDLCSAAQPDPMYTAAVNFCHGFAVGVFRVLQQQDMANAAGRHMFCLPNPMPTRNEGIAGFVQWARADVGRSALPAADGIATFLTQQFPCPRGR